MKKAISFLLALLLMSSSFTFYSPAANALGVVWVKDYYKDKFGDKTDQYYLTNKSQFNGTYNSDSVSNGELGANLIFERDGEVLLAYLTLFLNGMDQLKNSASSNDYYDVSVKRADGSVFDTNGSMVAGENRIRIDASMELAQALRANNGVVKIYIEDSYYSNNNFLFIAECGNFDDLYNQEILVPYQEEKYQAADQLLEEKKYDEAAEAFRALGDYKDSATRVKEVGEEKNADAYAKAEELLKNEQFDEAAKAFEALGDYKDSAARVDEVFKAQKWASIAVGETYTFGSYEQDNNTSNGKENVEWLVLAKEGDRMLIISKYALDCQQYNTSYTGVTWETCSLRKWLNSTFLNAAFSEDEKAMIPSVTVSADKKPSYRTTPGNDPTNPSSGTSSGNDMTDQVFLLSIQEVNKYFSSSEARKCTPTAYATAQGASTSNSNKVDDIATCWWWLRSSGDESLLAAYVDCDGRVNINGRAISHAQDAVRPALWVSLGS